MSQFCAGLQSGKLPGMQGHGSYESVGYRPASKVWGEALGRVYADTHRLSVICLRFGSVNAEERPHTSPWARSVWCSQRDAIQAVVRAIHASDEMRFDAFYVVSNNKYCWVDLDHSREGLGYVPQDSADDRPEEVAA
jgi:uronate dehydrogenase